jgi:CubicO group peptidase (beta-lactamase class C family)
MLTSRQFALVALLCLTTGLANGQDAEVFAPEIEQRIQHVTAGLTSGVVIKGNEHATQTLANRMKELRVPGVSITVIHGGKIEWARGFGVRSLGGPPVTANTMFQAASISKPLASMAALRMVQEGKLSLDADVNTFLSSWKFPAEPVAIGKIVTLRELLTHTSGTNVHGFGGYASGEPVPTLLQVLDGEKPANTPAIHSERVPGTTWKYSGGGYIVVQQVLVDTSKESFPKLMRDSVLVPIGMLHSTYEQPLPEALRGYAATPYRANADPVEGGAHTYPEMAAAGLWTTPTDLARYAIEVEQSLLGKANHVLSTEMTQQMLTPGIGHWGLGVEIGGADSNPYFSHGGANEGFRNFFLAYENSGDGAIVMTNSDAGEELANEIMQSIADEYGWPDYHSTARVVLRIDPKILAGYVGTFELRKDFDLVVTSENGQLIVQAAGEGRIPMYAESEMKFFSTIIPAEIEFVKDAQGDVTQLILHRSGHDMKAPRK